MDLEIDRVRSIHQKLLELGNPMLSTEVLVCKENLTRRNEEKIESSRRNKFLPQKKVTGAIGRPVKG